MPLAQGWLGEAHVVHVDVAAMAGYQNRHSELLSAQGGEITGGIKAVAVQHVEGAFAKEPGQKPAVPRDEEARGKETRMAHHRIGKSCVVGPEGQTRMRSQHDDVMSKGLKLTGEGVDDHFLTADFGRRCFRVKADAHDGPPCPE